MASAPVFVGIPKTWHAGLATANTNRDGTGTLATVLTAGASGSRIDAIRGIAAGTVTAGVVRLFLADGVSTRLFREILVPATTPSTSVETWTQDLNFPDGFVLPAGWSLRASTHNAENFNVIARGGDL